MFNNVREQKMRQPQNSVCQIKLKSGTFFAVSLLCIAVMLPTLFQAVRATAAQFDDSERSNNSFLQTTRARVGVQVTVLENMSIQFENGHPVMRTNFELGASIRTQRVASGLILFWVSANY